MHVILWPIISPIEDQKGRFQRCEVMGREHYQMWHILSKGLAGRKRAHYRTRKKTGAGPVIIGLVGVETMILVTSVFEYYWTGT